MDVFPVTNWLMNAATCVACVCVILLVVVFSVCAIIKSHYDTKLEIATRTKAIANVLMVGIEALNVQCENEDSTDE